jgi:hypothetical protein
MALVNFLFYQKRKIMSSEWAIGNHVMVQGMPKDFKLLSYTFIFGGCVELVLESHEGNRIFLKRRKSEISYIDSDYHFDQAC